VNRHISAAFTVAFLAALSEPALAQPAPDQGPPPAAPPAPAPPTGETTAPARDTQLQKEVELQRADLEEQDSRIQALEKQLKDLKSVQAPQVDTKNPPVPAPLTGAAPKPAEESPFKITGYVQAQYEGHQESEDQLAQGGGLLNQNRFLLRRTRLRVTRDWKYGGALIEFDANTVRGPAIGVQRAEVSLAYRDADQKPYVQASLGLFDNPFGRELVESSRDRVFMERSYASRAFFPSEPDLGLRISGQAAWFRYAVAVVNGQPLGDRTGYILQDPNSHKDVLGRVGVDVTLPPAVRVIGGVSMLNGKGFKPGTDATKNTIAWRDNISEDGVVQVPELIGIPAAAAQASRGFDRWLVGADLGFEWTSKFGVTHLYGEFSVGSNMDRNVFIADPTTSGFDVRELGYYVSAYHEFKSGPIVGFRFDQYNPNSDFIDSRRGKSVPQTETVTTYAPLIGFQVPHTARLVAEYDIIRDSMARNDVGVPVDRKNNVLTIRLQGEL